MWPAVQDDQRPTFNASSNVGSSSSPSDQILFRFSGHWPAFNELIILLSYNPNSHPFIHYHNDQSTFLSVVLGTLLESWESTETPKDNLTYCSFR